LLINLQAFGTLAAARAQGTPRPPRSEPGLA
jgi:hypothetical protein